MGIQQGKLQETPFNPVAEGYERIESENGAVIWINRTTGEELE